MDSPSRVIAKCARASGRRSSGTVSPMSQDGSDNMSPGLSDLFNKPIIYDGLSPGTFSNSTPQKSSCQGAFKRPSPPVDDTMRPKPKRAREALSAVDLTTRYEKENNSSGIAVQGCSKEEPANRPETSAPKLDRALSEPTFSSVKSAVDKIDSDPQLVGDGTKRYILPIVAKGKHSDLKEISPHSLVSLIDGKYQNVVANFKIVDCRYPYEFEGGHIRGAINVYTKQQAYDHFLRNRSPLETDSKFEDRHIVVFHCEFSSQRGPDLCRFLREWDRKFNQYPRLHYPELYVLHGGYKAFFEAYQQYCVPQVYRTMMDPDFTSEFRLYRGVSKTDSLDGKRKKSASKLLPFRQTSMKKLDLDQA